MDDAKRKEIETLLCRLINDADRDTKKPERNIPRPPGNIQVMWAAGPQKNGQKSFVLSC